MGTDRARLAGASIAQLWYRAQRRGEAGKFGGTARTKTSGRCGDREQRGWYGDRCVASVVHVALSRTNWRVPTPSSSRKYYARAPGGTALPSRDARDCFHDRPAVSQTLHCHIGPLPPADAFAAYFADSNKEADRPVVFSAELGLAVEAPPEGLTIDRLWAVL